MAESIIHFNLWAGLWMFSLLLLSIFCTRHFVFGKSHGHAGRKPEHCVLQSKSLAKLRTIRISEIPIGMSKQSVLAELKKLVGEDSELKTILNKVDLSRCTLVRKTRHHASSTLQVHSSLSPNTIVNELGKHGPLGRFKFDCEFHGITPLFENDGDAKVDVVAVPGLASHPVGSWTLSDGSGDFWLRDFLPHDLPNARVLIYGYDSKLDNSRSTDNIETMGNALLQSLKALRASTQTINRPIVFVAHSLGGLILKETILKAHDKRDDDDGCRGIADGCYALLMFGVPNTGLRNREELQRIVGGQPNESLINDLVVDRNGQPKAYLRGLMTQFATRCEDRYKVVCFYETRISPTIQRQESGQLAESDEAMLLVSVESATSVGLTTLRHQYNVNLPRDHSGLCKLNRTDDYEIVLERLKPLVEEAASRPRMTMPGPDDKHLDRIRKVILRRLPLNYTRNPKRFPDTTWLFENSHYRQWLGNNPPNTESPGMITLRGALGSGKSVLMKRAFEEVETSDSNVNIWHCFESSPKPDASRLKKSSRGFLFSLFVKLLESVEHKPWDEIRQLSQDLQDTDDAIEHIPDEVFENLIESLLILNKTTDGDKTVTFRLFIDALEQCSNTAMDTGSKLTDGNDGIKNMLHFLKELEDLRRTDHVDIRICVSRRYTPTFSHLEPPTTVIRVEDHIGHLVKAFLKDELAKMHDNKLFHFFFPRLEDHVLNGYLWASLFLDRIKAEASISRRLDQFKILDHIPHKVQEMYKDVLSMLDKSHNIRAVRLLQTALVAVEPMTLNQLRHALGFMEEFPFSSIQEWEQSRAREPTGEHFVTCLRELTYGLLTTSLPKVSYFFNYQKFSTRPIPVPQDTPIVCFTHSTTENFFRNAANDGWNDLAKELVDSKSNLALLEACFRALAIFGSEEDIEEFTFINYACEFWLHHAREADNLLDTIDRGMIPDFVLRCTNVTTLLLKRQKKLLERSHAKEHLGLNQPQAGFMTYAATFGCTGLLRMHLKECQQCTDLNNPQLQTVLRTALQSSITWGWYETAEYLISVYCRAGFSLENDGFLLYKACYAGDIKTVEFLLSKGADASVEYHRGYIFPLHAAIAKGRADIVNLLLSRAGTNAPSLLAQKGIESATTAFHFVINVQRPSASKGAILEKMLLYIPKGSKVLEAKDRNGNTPLSLVEKLKAKGQVDIWRLKASLEGKYDEVE
ncbi:unnamed protein product [Fusarium graminearum]|nr:unnamed protein product [Fusarium graminearum]VTO81487.1 unnamed protein product [Fusarium graminearum]